MKKPLCSIRLSPTAGSDRDTLYGKIRHKVGTLLSRLASDPAHGIDQVLQPRQIKDQHGYPGAAFVVAGKDGYMFSEALHGPMVAKSKDKGVHGHPPTDPAMDAVFMVAGPGIAVGRNLGRIAMVDVAPTVAKLLGEPLADQYAAPFS